MLPRVSSAGIVVDEQHGLVDCGPRRLDPESDRFRQVISVCPLLTPDQPEQELAASETVCNPENN
jgi:hypothetical protein